MSVSDHFIDCGYDYFRPFSCNTAYYIAHASVAGIDDDMNFIYISFPT